jgi:hypothetical protein
MSHPRLGQWVKTSAGLFAPAVSDEPADLR